MIHRMQQFATRDTTNDSKWQRVTTNDNKWYNEWQRVVQWVTTSDTTNHNNWRVTTKWQWETTSDNEQLFWLISFFFLMREKRTTMHPKENSLTSTQGWFIWSTPVNFRQYLLIELFNPPDFFWLSLTLKYSNWALYNFISGTDTKSQIVGKTII